MTIEFDDLSLYVDVNEARGTLPIMFLHSALTASQELETIRDRFPERTTIALDLPGHGESQTSKENADTAWFGQILRELLDHLGVAHVDIIGYSLGGYAGLELSAIAPEKVRSVVSHAMKYYWDAPGIEAAMQMFSKARAPQHTIAFMAHLLRNFNTRQLAVSDIQRSRVPILLSTGALDDFVTEAEVQRLASEIGSSQVVANIYPKVRHSLRSMPMDIFEKDVREFWKSIHVA